MLFTIKRPSVWCLGVGILLYRYYEDGVFDPLTDRMWHMVCCN